MTADAKPSSDEPQPEPAKEPVAPISLEKLTDAFSEMMSPAEPAAESVVDLEEESGDGAPEGEAESTAVEEEEDDLVPVSPQSVIEAMLFVGDSDNRPLAAAAMAEQIRGVEEDEVEAIVADLNELYQVQNCAYEIVRQDGGYRMSLRPSQHRVRDRFYGKVKDAKLSQPAVEVLALVAYNQPLTADKVTEMRGHPSGGLLRQLVRRELLRIERPAEKPRKTHYHTTDRFLALFGLESLDELPDSPDFDE